MVGDGRDVEAPPAWIHGVRDRGELRIVELRLRHRGLQDVTSCLFGPDPGGVDLDQSTLRTDCHLRRAWLGTMNDLTSDEKVSPASSDVQWYPGLRGRRWPSRPRASQDRTSTGSTIDLPSKVASVR